MEARNAVLGRIRAALGTTDRPALPEPAPPRVATGTSVGLVELFAERVLGYRGEVVVTDEPSVAIRDVLARHDARRVGVAGDFPAAMRPLGVELVVDGGAGPRELDGLDASLTTCAGACAETGTIALDGGPGQGRRALTLVPDLHVCVVSRAEIVRTFPELLAQLKASVEAGRPLVLVSGPSATSDIGLERVEGVHGPRRLVVVIAP